MIRADFDHPRETVLIAENGARVLILGDPADLYVCSDAALSDRTPICGCGRGPAEWDDCCDRAWRVAHTVVTGSTAPRVPLSDETLAEWNRMHVTGSTSHIHLGDLR